MVSIHFDSRRRENRDGLQARQRRSQRLNGAKSGRPFREAFAEWLHLKARNFCGIQEDFKPEELVAEKYRGIRPAFGYPACPDHTPKTALFELLQAQHFAGITLTESMAMMPGSSVSGIYLNHPKAHYFAVGKIGRDQVADYAPRANMTFEQAEKWLSPNLGYMPEKIQVGR